MRRKPRKPGERSTVAPAPPAQPNSLFGEILDWMLAPLLFLWPVSIIITHNVADNIASQPYDQALAENVRALSRLIVAREDGVGVDFPAPPRALFRADEEDVLYFQVADDQGRLISGDAEIPRPPLPLEIRAEWVQFRDDLIEGEEVRVAYQFLQFSPPALGETSGQVSAPLRNEASGGPLVLVQVAETRNKRSDLASRVVTGVLLPQFAIIPLAVILVWVGLTRGIAPLNRLQSLIRRRRPTDLSPIASAGVPEEVRPLIVAFNDMMARLEENLQAQQRFIADAAHQMRTPLTGLKMQTDLALQENDPQQVRQSLVRIAQSAERASHLINQLLSLARAESSSEALYAVDLIPMHQVVSEVVEDLFPRARAKGIDLGLESQGSHLLVEGNPILLREMVKNLVDNAIKYTPPGGAVTVRLKVSAKHLVLEVEDSGIGIAESERERVFERFYRVLGSGEDGSGLGLPIVREIADILRATVTLLPTASGVGTLARVSFPLNHPAHGTVADLPDLVRHSPQY